LGNITKAKEKRIQDEIIKEEIDHIQERYIKNFKDEECLSDDAGNSKAAKQ